MRSGFDVTSPCMAQTAESIELMNRSSYVGLPERFFARVNPVPVAKPRLLRFNHALAAELGLDIGDLDAEATGEPVFREEALPGAILTRVAGSFVRVGTFQYFAARDDVDAVRLLADYVIDRHFPEARADPQPYLSLLRAVTGAQASLIAGWMHVGFIHGVMNTDNMAVSGGNIEFGPFAFLDAYHPAAGFSSIDPQGPYAHRNQTHAPLWNLSRFSETLLPIIHG